MDKEYLPNNVEIHGNLIKIEDLNSLEAITHSCYVLTIKINFFFTHNYKKLVDQSILVETLTRRCLSHKRYLALSGYFLSP